MPKLYPIRIIFAVLSVACMCAIFYFSAENAEKSSETSGKVTETVVEITVKNYDKKTPAQKESIKDKFTFYVRKSAHFTLYTILGFCVSFVVGKRRLFSIGSLGVVVFCFLYALGDEFHQSFSPGRSCEFRDMMIDTSGAATGMLLSMIVMLAASAIASRIKRRSKPNS